MPFTYLASSLYSMAMPLRAWVTKESFARYGGRLSSVLDITMKDGNKEQFGGEAGIGIISSQLVLEDYTEGKIIIFDISPKNLCGRIVEAIYAKDVKGGYFLRP